MRRRWYVWTWAWISFLASSTGSSGRRRAVRQLEAKGKPPGTVRNVLVPVRAALTEAVRLGLLPANPLARADLPAPPSFRDPLRAGETDQCGPLLFDLALGARARLSEFAGLRRWDADLEACEVSIAPPPASEEARMEQRSEDLHQAEGGW